MIDLPENFESSRKVVTPKMVAAILQTSVRTHVPCEVRQEMVNGYFSFWKVKKVANKRDYEFMTGKDLPYLISLQPLLASFRKRSVEIGEKYVISFMYDSLNHFFYTRLIDFEGDEDCPDLLFTFPREISVNEKRDFYRIKITHLDPVKVKINGYQKEIANLSPRGIAVFIDRPSDFRTGTVFKNFVIVIDQKEFNVTATARHITRLPNKKFLMGLQFDVKGSNIADTIYRFLINKQLKTGRTVN